VFRLAVSREAGSGLRDGEPALVVEPGKSGIGGRRLVLLLGEGNGTASCRATEREIVSVERVLIIIILVILVVLLLTRVL